MIISPILKKNKIGESILIGIIFLFLYEKTFSWHFNERLRYEILKSISYKSLEKSKLLLKNPL